MVLPDPSPRASLAEADFCLPSRLNECLGDLPLVESRAIQIHTIAKALSRRRGGWTLAHFQNCVFEADHRTIEFALIKGRNLRQSQP